MTRKKVPEIAIGKAQSRTKPAREVGGVWTRVNIVLNWPHHCPQVPLPPYWIIIHEEIWCITKIESMKIVFSFTDM